MRKLLLALVVLSMTSLAFGQTTTENYVKNTTYRTKTTTGTVSKDNKIEAITYYDGLGRPKQSISKQAGGNKQDIITPIVYDAFGRQTKEYLPYSRASSSLHYQEQNTSFFNSLNSQYQNKYPGDISAASPNPYSEKGLENSPLNRVLSQGAPGDDWRVGGGHDIKFDYKSNSASEVKHYQVTISESTNASIKVYTPSLVQNTSNNGYYLANALYKTITKDENWTSGTNHTTEEFKDKQGRIVLKRTYDDLGSTSTAHDTYYVYDDYGNLSYVIPPKVTTASITATELNELCYQYKYDKRNRLVEKKLPGKAWEYIVYDTLDRPIITFTNGKWLFTKYDAFGRVVYTGLAGVPSPPMGSREILQNGADSWATVSETKTTSTTMVGVPISYSNVSYPNNIGQLYTINYYDDYTFDGFTNMPSNYEGQAIVNHNNSDKIKTKGLATGSKVRVLGTNHWITTITGYDTKGRPIYIKTENPYLGTVDIVKSALNFTGEPYKTETTHTKDGKTITITDYYTYDHAGRLVSHEQDLDGKRKEVIARNHYDELGQLEKKHVGSTVPIVSVYTKKRYVNDTGELVTKVGPTSITSGLSTQETISGNGYTSFIVVNKYHSVVAGLSYNDTNYSSNSIDYGISTSSGTAQVYEKGVAKGSTITINDNDNFRIERRNNTIYYSKNGKEFYTSEQPTSNASMVGDATLISTGSKLKNFIIVDTDKGLQTVDYTYNVRGWLKEINKPNALGNDLFGFKINYNTPTHGATGLFNGNISETEWKTANTDHNLKWYKYRYDALNRIEQAIGNNNNYNLTNVSYDKNGNIINLERRGHTNAAATTFGVMDHLYYDYDSGNKLIRVSDTGDTTYGFKDKSNGSLPDYVYDANGNMTMDRNKDITNITYNHLNLPTKVDFGGGRYINYTYDATGIKLSKQVNIPAAGAGKATLYAGNYIYESERGLTALKFFNHPEGYVDTSGDNYDYVYQYKDHLGNVRLSYKDVNAGDTTVFYDDMENSSGWDSQGALHGTSAVESTERAYTGNTSVKLSKQTPGHSYAHSNVWIPINNSQPTEYIYSGWVYSDGPGIGFHLFMNEDDETSYYTQVDHITTSIKNKWVYLEKRISIPANIDKINFRIAQYNGNGSVWLDNVSIRKLDSEVNLEILEENNYYPFGLKHKGYNNVVNSSNPALKKNYNGKEFQDELGLNWHDYGARNYDAALGRFMNIDRFAENYFAINPYQYTLNNPILFIDINGDCIDINYGQNQSETFCGDINSLSDKALKNDFVQKVVASYFILKSSYASYNKENGTNYESNFVSLVDEENRDGDNYYDSNTKVVDESNGERNKGNSAFDPTTNSLHWNPDQASKVGDNIYSSLVVLEHEGEHAYKLFNPDTRKAYFDGINSKSKIGGDDANEDTAVGAENVAAKVLNELPKGIEKTREYYFEAVPYTLKPFGNQNKSTNEKIKNTLKKIKEKK